MNNKNNKADIIGAKIKQLRLQQGMTQEQLSDKLGIDSKKLSRIETGRCLPSLPITNELTKAINFNFFELLNDINNVNNVEIPDNLFIQSLNILKAAKNKEERKCYLRALKHTQSCLNLATQNDNSI